MTFDIQFYNKSTGQMFGVKDVAAATSSEAVATARASKGLRAAEGWTVFSVSRYNL